MLSLLDKYSQASRALNKDDLLELSHLCECSKAFLLANARGVVEEHPTAPVLLQYFMDLTPVKVRKQVQGKSSSGDKRSVVSKQELLVQLLQ
eukprot:6488402-Amphidinium_carterae.1